jgi:hypothetical protein
LATLCGATADRAHTLRAAGSVGEEVVIVRARQLVASVAAAVLAGTGVAVATGSTPAAAASCAGTAPSDFNGDGISDAAIGQPDPFNEHAGFVHIIYGTRAGLTADAHGSALDDQLLSAAGASFTFGDALATGDFNGDGCTDLAVGDQTAKVGGAVQAGAVHVFYGSKFGLTDTGQSLTSAAAGVTPQTYQYFGESLTTGDLNGDGTADLVVGDPYAGGGSIYVYPGSRTAPLSTAARYRQGDGTVPGTDEANDEFGDALATGDFDGDGLSDLAVGDDNEGNGEGAVMVLRGSATGALLTSVGRQTWNQGSSGIVGVREPHEFFGSSLATGDFNGDSHVDLAIGVPEESVNGVGLAGMVNVIYSAATDGLASQGNQGITANQGALGGATSNALFGYSLAAGDFDGDRFTDLAVGSPDRTVRNADGAGAVSVLTGTTDGLNTSGAVTWTQGTAGVYGTPQSYDDFGSGLTALRTTSAVRDDLLIGVDHEILNGTCPDGGNGGTGLAEFLPSTTLGLTATGSSAWSLYTPGIKSDSSQLCGFGTALA